MVTVSAIPAYTDNYIWAIRHREERSVYIVDPGDHKPVEQFLQKNGGLDLAGILITHRHWDHITGINPLVSAHPAPVIGLECEAIPRVTQPVAEGHEFSLWNEIPVRVLETPGHMPEHVSYFLKNNGNFMLFCGDTLFSAGCGRIFSGSFEALKNSLDRLKQLPPHTQVYCTHEYTVANLRFARAIEGDTDAINRRQADVDARLTRQQPSLPSTIEAELTFNPFLRCGEPAVIAAAERHAGRKLDNELEVFTVLREWKNTY